jgi:SAM-dependent methyltransferase
VKFIGNAGEMKETTLPFRVAIPLRPLFTLTILLGSFLLFLIQPMFGRSVLPMLGGAPSVWNTAMLFYQVTLLLGYLYAHALSRWPIRRQIAIHLSLFVVAALTLPVAVARWLPEPGATSPALWLLGLLTVSIGPVFFVASAQAPLMQSWFARSRDPAAANPYFLYAASNTGSFAALVAYPLLIEPSLRLGVQSWLWSAGFVLLAAVVALSGLAVAGNEAPAVSATTVAATPVSWRQRGRWTLLAFVASALLLSTTTHLTTDIMAMPLLWVIPLGVYLLSFILAFGDRGALLTRWAERSTPLLLMLVGSLSCLQVGPSAATYLAVGGILLLFVVALALHGRLAAEKPDAASLTDFYLWISVGGALGGVLCALVAPVLFDWPYEHPILLVTAAVLIPGMPLGPNSTRLWQNRRVRIGAAVLVAGLAIWLGTAFSGRMASAAEAGLTPPVFAGLFLVAAAATIAVGQRRLFPWCFAMLLISLGGGHQLAVSRTDGARERSFFGVYTVEDDARLGMRTLMHGTTLHGIQSLDPAQQRVPMIYYAPKSGAGLAITAVPRLYGPTARIGFVGLGAGTLTCFSTPHQRWTAYEIDPVVVEIARKRFSYIEKCRPDLRVVVGDARLTLGKATPADLDVLAVDAFSSDSIPLHLVTREAFRVCGRALQPDGMLLIHISNRFLDLEPVIAAIARAEGWTARARTYYPGPEAQPHGRMFVISTWLVLTRSPGRMATIEAATSDASGPAWRPLEERRSMTPWSDEFASILPVLKLR